MWRGNVSGVCGWDDDERDLQYWHAIVSLHVWLDITKNTIPKKISTLESDLTLITLPCCRMCNNGETTRSRYEIERL